MTEATQAPLFDPFAPGFTDDPYPHFQRMRDQAPVYEHPLGFWLLTGYSDVHTLLRSRESVDMSNLGAGPYRDLNDQMRGQSPTTRMSGLSMLDRDPPDHTRLRKLVTKAFTPRSIAALEPRIERLVAAKLDAIEDAGQTDLVGALAFPLPFEVISEMMGMPDTNRERVRELSGLLVRSLEPVVDPVLMKAIDDANEELEVIARDVIAWKRGNPADDLLTALISAEDNGDVLNDEELVAQVVLLYVAGHETTVNLIANGVLALLNAPEQLALLRRRPELAENAVEELLRYDSPVQASRRITLQPLRFGDVEIPAGTFVLASLASANRDATFWGADADRVRLDREGARSHVSFGSGVHHCLGASLARMEGRLAINGLVQRFPRLAAAGEMRWNGRINLRGPETLSISV